VWSALVGWPTVKMKISVAFLVTSIAPALAIEATPIGKILQILGDCESKVIREGEESQKVFDEFTEWCEDRSRNLAYEIKTGKAQVAELKATIEKEASSISALGTEIEEHAASISSDDKDLAAATTVRQAEAADFAASSKELTEVIDALDRAIGLIEREQAKGSASMMQIQSAKNLADAFKVMVQASVFSSADASRLTALVQSSSSDDDDDSNFGAPDAAVYESHSGGIVDTLQGLLDKAQGQLGDAQKKETTSKNNFEMLKQSLEDEIKYANKELAEAKTNLAGSQEGKAVAEGDLSVTSKDVSGDEDASSDLHHDCLTRSQDFESETKSRGEELKAIGAAKKAVNEAVNSASFLQLSSDSRDEPAKLVFHYVRNLARKQDSKALAQLASRISSAIHMSSGQGGDPFAKVKGLITDMLKKLEEDGAADATHKAYCDKEMAESKQKKIEKTAEVEHLSTKIDQKSAASAKLKEEVADLQKELSQLASATAEMDTLRAEEKSVFTVNKAETEQGLEGVKLALKVLRDYYSKSDKGHSAADGTSSGVIGLLEVVESDFSKGLAEMIAVEDAAVAEHYMQTMKNAVTKKMKEQDVKYKTKEHTGLDKAVTEHTSDRDGAQEELDAVLEYVSKLNDMCIAKPETYGERASRRQAEIDGLKQALSILESETAFMQKSARGFLRAHHAKA